MAKGEKFLHKLNFKYKLTILNENTLEEAWHIRLSRLSVFLFCFAIAVIYFFLIAVLIIKTPLRTFMPGYTDMNLMRKQVIEQSLQLDSVMEAAAHNEMYLDMLRKVVTGQMELTDSSTTLSALVAADIEKADVNQTDRERSFCSQYEIDQRYAMNASSVNVDSKYMLMQKPSFGIVTKAFDPSSGRLGISVSVKPGNSVHCAMDGEIVFNGYSAHNRYCMQIQHSGNFITTYKFTQPFFRQIGEHVHAGEILATLRENEQASEVTFEIWSNGQALNPQNYMTFNTGQQPADNTNDNKRGKKQRQNNEGTTNAPAQQQPQQAPARATNKTEATQPIVAPAEQKPATPVEKKQTAPAEQPAQGEPAQKAQPTEQQKPAEQPKAETSAPTPAPAPAEQTAPTQAE